MIISSVTNALIYKTGQPGKEAAPVTQAFRQTTGLPQDILGVAKALDRKLSGKWSKL